MKIKKDITFIYMDKAEYQGMLPIYNEAKKRGYQVRFSENKLEECEIGFYCQHDNFPQYSKFSAIMLHDIIQAYGRWPDIWFQEPWNKYDVGFLPGKKWSEMWKNSSEFFYSRPKHGVYEVGWPKSDILGSLNLEEKKSESVSKYGLDKSKKTILYAPAWENNGKQDDFVKAMQEMDVNILIKQYPAKEELFPDMYRCINEMYKLHNGLPNVYILDPATNIMEAIIMADILVSEESSTMAEAVMLGKPAISVSDWLIPDTIPSRYPKDDYDFVIKTIKSELVNTVDKILMNYKEYKGIAEEYSKNNYSHFGKSAVIIMDIIDDLIDGKISQNNMISPSNRRNRITISMYIKFRIKCLRTEISKHWSIKYKTINFMLNKYKRLKKNLWVKK